LPEEQPCDLI
jgi:hypothetical protein